MDQGKPSAARERVAVTDDEERARRMVRTWGLCSADVEDVTQEVLIALDARRTTFQPPENVEIERKAFALAAAFDGLPGARAIDENPAHGFRRRREEVAAVFELLVADEPQVRFMHQRRGAERLFGSFVRHLGAGELSQFVVHERE